MKIKPTKKQLEFLEWEIGMFFHFGIRTFYSDHYDWDNKEMPASKFNPKQLDCEQWVQVAKELGATYVLLTAKHHDGFALWHSKYTEYSVKNTPWRGGKGDVVQEYVNACRKYGLKIGLYYSPAQWGDNAVEFKNAEEYDDYFINQITELLSNYGKIDYLWFDGCGSEGHEYDHQRIINEIFRLQPDILTFCDPEWIPCVRWIGNEDGFASLDNPLVVSKWDFSVLAEESISLSKASFLPAECDCRIRSTWFYAENDDSLKSLEELFGMYEMSVGHGSNFLLNVAPDATGIIPNIDRIRVRELGQKIKENYSTPIVFNSIKQEGENEFSIEHRDFTANYCRHNVPPVNTVVISEDLTEGQSIKQFKIYAYLPHNTDKKILIFNGNTVGHKVICRFSTIRTPKITVQIEKAEGEYAVKDIKAYFVK